MIACWLWLGVLRCCRWAAHCPVPHQRTTSCPVPCHLQLYLPAIPACVQHMLLVRGTCHFASSTTVACTNHGAHIAFGCPKGNAVRLTTAWHAACMQHQSAYCKRICMQGSSPRSRKRSAYAYAQACPARQSVQYAVHMLALRLPCTSRLVGGDQCFARPAACPLAYSLIDT